MKCPLCSEKMLEGKTNLPYELPEERVIVIIHVPALICTQCGDSFVEIEVLRRVEKIIDRAGCDGMTMGFIEYEKAA